MKIMHVISSPSSGGAEVYVLDMAEESVNRGVQVVIIFISRAKDVNRCEIFEQNYLDRLTTAGIPYFFLGHECRKNPLKGMLRLRTLCNKYAPSVIHCHLYYALAFCLLSVNKKIVYTHHNFRLGIPRYIYFLLDYIVDTYIGICSGLGKTLSNITNKKVVTIFNAVSTKRLVASDINNNTGSEILQLLSVGRLGDQKNYLFLLQALAKVDRNNYLLKIAGEGPLLNELESTVEALGLSNRVQFLGNRTDIAELMDKSDIFIMSSHYEGLPIALIEATLTGLPSLVTDVGGCREVIDNCQSGFVVQSGDTNTYVHKLQQLIDDASLRQRLSLNAQNLSEKYTIDTSVTKHIALYKSLQKK